MMKKGSTKKGKGLVIMCLVLAGLAAFCCLSVIGINAYVIGKSKPYLLTPQESKTVPADCILVLGCGLVNETTPSDMLADRIDRGIELCRGGMTGKLLMSGDHGRKEYDEVNVMKARAVAAGVPSENVFMDHAGFSTYESMVRAKEVFGAKTVIIVTQKFHLSRAVYIARQLGLNAYGCEAMENTYVTQAYSDVREVAARCKDFFYCLLQPAPTFSGDAISLAGSGNVTNDENTPRFLTGV